MAQCRDRGLGPCSFPSCSRPAWARQLCPTHYQRLRLHGDPSVVLPHSKPPVNTRPKRVRFEEKVRHADHSTDECCVWTGAVSTRGYGQLRTGARGLIEMAHRLAWEFWVGPIPEGMEVCHRCDNPPCVRAPEHLFLGTHLDNMRDMIAKGRRGRRPPGDLRRHVPRGVEMGAIVKLTENDVVTIRRRALAGERFTKIALDYPVTSSHIGMIVARRTWKHIP